MALTASPHGLKPVNLIGGTHNSGSFREIRMPVNNTAGIFAGDVIQLGATGSPQALAATITTGTTTGVVGVCVGVRYVAPGTRQPTWAQFLPANAITAGFTDVFIRVLDNPDAVFQIQGSAAFGTLTNGPDGAIGKNAALGNFGAGNVATGNSGVNLVVGANGASLAGTAALAMRIVGVVAEEATDPFPELLVKFNQGAHSYYLNTGV
jgi:hypothetical protein